MRPSVTSATTKPLFCNTANGDIIRLNAAVGTLNALVDEDTWAERVAVELSDTKRHHNSHGIGRELFGGMRRNVLSAEEGAITWL